MWQLLILLALWLGTLGLGRAELTAAQHQGLQVALEEFHKHPRVQWAFQKTSVDSAMDKVSSTTPGREGVRASPLETQEAGAKVLGFCEHPALWRKAITPATNWVVLFHCGEKGQVTFQELLCLLTVCRQPSQVGTFVRLEFTLQQTGCGKKDWKRTECKVKPNGVSGDVHPRV